MWTTIEGLQALYDVASESRTPLALVIDTLDLLSSTGKLDS